MLSTIAQIIALAASAYALYKGVIEFSLAKKPRLREDYEFAKKLLTEIDESTHNMIVEKGYIALTGDKELRADEIRYFLGAPAPSSSLRKYSYARNFVKFLPNSQSTGHRVAYIDSFANEKKRAWYKRRKLCYYWIFALAAFFPIIFFSLVVKAGFINALALAFASLCAFGVIAADALFDYARMLRAEEVVLEHGGEP